MDSKEEARFIAKIENMDDPVGCWEWTGTADPDGYGRFWFRNKLARASRVSAKYWANLNIDGLQVCHHCDNPRCVNPAHLFVGTAFDNAMDSNAKGRRLNPARPVATPLGNYPSIWAAAKAHGNDWTTIVNRIDKQWPGYRFI